MLTGNDITMHHACVCLSRPTPDAAVTSAQYYNAARDALDGLRTYSTVVAPKVPAGVASQPDVQSMNANVNSFLAASENVPLTVCPVNCFNMGSFYGA